VPSNLAVIPGIVDADAVPLHKHHINMVKFSSTDDLDFRTVLRCIKFMVQMATPEVRSSWEREIKIRS
jgi:hypothetical protein